MPPLFRRPSLPVYWIEAFAPLRLAIMPRPRSRSLDADLARLADSGIDTLVSLLEDDEQEAFGLEAQSRLCEEQGLAFRRFPIPDHDVPASTPEFLAFVDALVPVLAAGRPIGIHCAAGIGRSSLTAATLLLRAGVEAPSIFPTLCRARGLTVPETPAQALWFRNLVERRQS